MSEHADQFEERDDGTEDVEDEQSEDEDVEEADSALHETSM
jgi:hypothetical protein